MIVNAIKKIAHTNRPLLAVTKADYPHSGTNLLTRRSWSVALKAK